jgi:hypothetical protein
MDVDAFWELINHARSSARDDKHLVERVTTALEALPTEEILDFEEQMSEAEHQAYRWKVWGAAYLINGGCSDDGFQDFRGWLMGQGRDTFTRAVADPDSLAEHPAVRRMADSRRDGWLGLEALRFVAEETYEHRTGDHEAFYAALTQRHALRKAHAAQHPAGEEPAHHRGPAGEDWNFDDRAEMRRRLPRLASLFDHR